MPKVFITQIPHRKDEATDTFVPSINIAPAAEHGDIVIMMPPRATFYATADLIKQMRVHLEGYDYENGDSLVALGDPSVIAAASALLGRMFGRFILLKWDRNIGRYLPTHIQV